MNHYDCIVAGFGTAGSVAAIAAGRLGASVLVLESGTAPGGTHTVGGVGCYYFQQPVPGSLMAELDAACRHLISQSCWSTSLSETKKHVIEEKAAEAGVEVRYEAVISACRVESGILREIRWSDPEGEHTATAACFIDATGDALLCDLAGARLSHGRTSDGLFQPFSNSMLQVNGLDVGMCNFDAGRIDQYCEPAFSRMMLTSSHLHLREDFSLFRKLIAASELPGVREGRRLASSTSGATWTPIRMISLWKAISSGNGSSPAPCGESISEFRFPGGCSPPPGPE